MTAPFARVGIVTRDRAEILRRSIQSALAQEGVSIGVSVIDDGSRDGTPEVAEEFPSVEWVRWEESQGYVAARNYCMKQARELYFASLDDDAWFMDGDEIAIAVGYLEKHKAVGAVGFDILTPDRPQRRAREKAEQTAMFIGCGHIVRLSAFRKVGAYELAPGQYGGEEKDLCLRLLDGGYQVVSLPGVHVWHDKTPLARHLPEQHQSGVCNDLAMTLRRTPLLLLPAALLAKLYRHWVFAWRHRLLGPCLQGFWLFMRSLPGVWRSRKPVSAATLRAYVQLARP